MSSTADGMRMATDARQSAYKAGEAKCQAMGKPFTLVQENAIPTRMGIDTTVTIVFRCG
ncbi:hypothetical protein RQ831_18365 [Roseomonas gilardii]|uniref:Uncharacterized protein n=1 Tax=Roseomonas gilardii TaxID=257708 RepID=A0ABU3MJ32_9PROT|nr:hypothetical protein [Roseomonas gilardii]MDT8333021.1 hypothetical protein [Roseomonas gilardii]